MAYSRLYFLTFLAVCSFLPFSACGEAGVEKTDSKDVAAIEKVELRAERNYTDHAFLIEGCERARDTFFDCMVENVEPYLSRPSRSVGPALHQLVPRVGPTCQRWLRAVLRGLETKQIFNATVYGDLDAVALACHEESLAANGR